MQEIYSTVCGTFSGESCRTVSNKTKEAEKRGTVTLVLIHTKANRGNNVNRGIQEE